MHYTTNILHHSNLCLRTSNETFPPSVLPSCRASFMMVAPPGGSRLQGDLKKGWPCRQASSPGLMPSHIPLKSRTFSSSRDMISVSFCLSSSEGGDDRKTGGEKSQQTCVCFPSHKQNKQVSLTSHFLCFGLQLSLVIFRLAGNPFVLVLLPAQGKEIRMMCNIR